MGFFRKAGKKFEETKRTVIGDDEEFVCRDCETTLEEDYQYCPHCGEPAVEPID